MGEKQSPSVEGRNRATGLGNIAQAIHGINEHPNTYDVISSSTLHGKPEMSMALVEEQRRALRRQGAENLHGLSSGMLPNPRTLVLADLPSNDTTGRIVDTLVHFLRDCATKASLANLQASLERTAPLRSP
ncbi:hypothetical protein MMC08_000810 [Hypocenomyce scalaris]|nr:hypothetical protein [Hypocenomyce scalaris]